MRTHSRIVVFVLSWLAWLALTGLRNLQDVIAGGIVALLVALLAGHFLRTTPRSNPWHRRLGFGIVYLFRFLLEMLKANVHVAWIVLQPGLPIRPGIVKIHSELTAESALTLLANSITLTPGTLTVDIDPERHDLYVHWIDVEATDEADCSRRVGGRFEPLLREVLE